MVGSGGLFMLIAAAVLLCVGFAGGYGVRELVSRRRLAAGKRQYLERQAERKAAARSVIEGLASAAGAGRSSSYRRIGGRRGSN